MPFPSWTLRRLTPADHDALLRLNAENQPAVAAVAARDLPGLLASEGHHLVAVDAQERVLGYLLAYPRTSTFDDTEIAELRRLLAAPFYYICQVAVAREHRGRGIGRAFYAAVADEARRPACSRGWASSPNEPHAFSQRTTARSENSPYLCCDVNLDPPNPESLAFHHRLGFRQLATGAASNGFAIAYLVKNL